MFGICKYCNRATSIEPVKVDDDTIWLCMECELGVLPDYGYCEICTKTYCICEMEDA